MSLIEETQKRQIAVKRGYLNINEQYLCQFQSKMGNGKMLAIRMMHWP
jgi:hypothetical protein